METLKDVIESFLQEKYNDTSIKVVEYRITAERFTVRTSNVEEWELESDIIRIDSRQQICYEFSRKQFERFERKLKISKLYE